MAQSVSGPVAAVAGEPATVTWTVGNAGEAAATGSWTDTVYLSPETSLGAGATPLAYIAESQTVAVGSTYTGTTTVTLPDVADGTYYFIVLANSNYALWEYNRLSNNTGASTAVSVGHPNLTASSLTAPPSAESSSSIDVQWTVTNTGSRDATGTWADRIYLSQDETTGSGARLLGEVDHMGPLAPGASYAGSDQVTVPIDVSGSWKLVVWTDATNVVHEANAENDNQTTAPLAVTLAPYADLAVSGVTAPAQIIADPASVTVGWRVTNAGTGAGLTSTWTDEVVLSPNAAPGIGYGDIVLGTFEHDGGLALGASYSQTQTMYAPPSTSGRYHVFVVTDSGNAVFENGSKANNTASASAPLDIMPIPYAELAVSGVSAPATAESGTLIPVTWTVTNNGIGQTNIAEWNDTVTLSTGSDGTGFITNQPFDHLGYLAPGGSYTRTGDVQVPNGLSVPSTSP